VNERSTDSPRYHSRRSLVNRITMTDAITSFFIALTLVAGARWSRQSSHIRMEKLRIVLHPQTEAWGHPCFDSISVLVYW